MEPNSIRLTLAKIGESLSLGGCGYLKDAGAANIIVKIGKATRGEGLINRANGAHIIINEIDASLTIEVRATGFGQLIALGGIPSTNFNSSQGSMSIALICPDELVFCGSLKLSFLRIGDKIDFVRGNHFNNTVNAKIVPAGVGRNEELLRIQSSVVLQDDMKVSRTAITNGSHEKFEGNSVLLLDLGNPHLLGGLADVNLLVELAMKELQNDNVVALATDDIVVATVLAARTCLGTPLIWCGERDKARDLRFASIHDEGEGVLTVQRNNDELLLPVELFRNHSNNEDGVVRRKCSVRWREPVVVNK